MIAMKYGLLLLLPLLGACSGSADTPGEEAPVGVGTDWRYQPGRGYVQGDQVLGEPAFFDLTKKTADSGRHEAAAGMYDILIRNAQDPSIMQESYFGRGRSLIQINNLGDAYSTFQLYLNRFPNTDRDSEAKRQLFEVGRLMVTQGSKKYVIAIPYSSPEDGIRLMKRTLETYPREDFSPQYAFWLAEYLFQHERVDEAQVEYLFIVDQYRDHPVVPAAMLKLGECEMTRYRGIRFDTRALTEADKYYVRVLDEFPKSDMAKAAEHRRAYIQEELASKEFEDADYYEGKGFPKSAAVSYNTIIARYPKTSYAEKSRSRLKELGLPVIEEK